ncbi:MAG: hypothetical protein JSR82_17985 [Verrucomicrobia bacterium]|nr:hypothetical protein [Verrucomicrobiota bacterium]
MHLLLVGFLGVGSLAAQDSKSALEIFDAVMARLEERTALLKKMQYHQRLRTYQFDKEGNIVGKAEWRSIVRPGEKDPIEYVFESKEGKVTFVEDKPEGGKGRRGKDGDKGGEEGKDAKDQPGSIAAAVKKYNLRERYLWTRLPDTTIGGERVHVLAFEPRPGMKAKGREERFLGQLGGQLFVNRDDMVVVKATAALRATYRLFWIIARITELRFTYSTLPATGGDRLLRPIRTEAFTTVALPFSEIRQRHWLTADTFEARTPRKK